MHISGKWRITEIIRRGIIILTFQNISVYITISSYSGHGILYQFLHRDIAGFKTHNDTIDHDTVYKLLLANYHSQSNKYSHHFMKLFYPFNALTSSFWPPSTSWMSFMAHQINSCKLSLAVNLIHYLPHKQVIAFSRIQKIAQTINIVSW